MFWAFVILILIIRVRKSNVRDGKICHIGGHQSMEIESQKLDLWAKIESQRLELLVNDIVS